MAECAGFVLLGAGLVLMGFHFVRQHLRLRRLLKRLDTLANRATLGEDTE